MCGIKNGADGKGPVEISFVGGPWRQSANEHGPGTAGIEIVGLFCRYGDDIRSAGGADNIDRSGGWIGQVHGRQQARSARSDISEARAGLESDLWVGASVQRDICDGTVGQSPSGVRETWDGCFLIQIDDQPDICGSKRHDRAMRKRINAHSVRKRLGNCLAGRIGLRNHAAQIHGSQRSTCGNRNNRKRPAGVIHHCGNVRLGGSLKNELVVHGHTGRDVASGGNLTRHRRRGAGQIDELDVIRAHPSEGHDGQAVCPVDSNATGRGSRAKGNLRVGSHVHFGVCAGRVHGQGQSGKSCGDVGRWIGIRRIRCTIIRDHRDVGKGSCRRGSVKGPW